MGDANGILLSARGVRFGPGKGPPGRTALIDGLDLDVRAGERLILLGANGAGKSLTLRLLHGLLPPDAGEILWRGGAMGAAARREQAMVFQRPVILRRSVRANLRFALAAQGVGRAERRAREDEALARAGLAHLANRPARVLSGGEQQRLAVVRALSRRPRLLFLDEPTASLDPASAQAVEDLIRDACADGVAIVLVTHDAGQARRLGEDIAFMHDGRVAERGPARDLLDRPGSRPARAWLEGHLYTGAQTRPAPEAETAAPERGER